jgi:diguanylate cyclase (GGDEF)-like protein
MSSSDHTANSHPHDPAQPGGDASPAPTQTRTSTGPLSWTRITSATPPAAGLPADPPSPQTPPGWRGRLGQWLASCPCRHWPLMRLELRARLFVVAVPLAAAAAATAAILRLSYHSSQAFTALLLLACALLSVEAQVAGTRWAPNAITRDMLNVWFLPAALLLPPAYALILPFPALVYVQLRNRMRLHRRMFTAGANSLAYGAASLVFHTLPAAFAGHGPGYTRLQIATGLAQTRHLPPSHAGLHPVTWMVAVVACEAVAWLVSDGLMAAAITLTERNIPAITVVKDVWLNRRGLFEDLVQGVMATVTTLIVSVSLLLLPVAVVLIAVQLRFLMHTQLLQRARIDAKTQTLNGQTWQQDAETILARSRHNGSAAAVALLDLDYFKKVNDRYGHLAGDEVLRTVSRIIRDAVRTRDLVGRYGGEEFVLLLPQTSETTALAIAERIRTRIAQAPVATVTTDAGTPLHVTASIGVAALTTQAGLTELLAAADSALYRAKEQGRNRICVAAAGDSPAERRHPGLTAFPAPRLAGPRSAPSGACPGPARWGAPTLPQPSRGLNR